MIAVRCQFKPTTIANDFQPHVHAGIIDAGVVAKPLPQWTIKILPQLPKKWPHIGVCVIHKSTHTVAASTRHGLAMLDVYAFQFTQAFR
jgi:hypothetical protein